MHPLQRPARHRGHRNATQKMGMRTLVILSFRVSRGCELHQRVADTVIDAVAAV